MFDRIPDFLKPVELGARWAGPKAGPPMAYVVAIAAVVAATLLAVTLEIWITNVNMVLFFVVAVIVTGLRYGSGPAVAASILSFLSFNFFLTDPRHTFVVARENELVTLIFLLLIGLICGPAASQIRLQILLLTEANRRSEAMRKLAQELSIAEDASAVWRAVAQALSGTLNAECCIATSGEENQLHLFPTPSIPLNDTDRDAIERTLGHASRAEGYTGASEEPAWSAFPITKDGSQIAAAIIRFRTDDHEPEKRSEAMIDAMLRQGADTWRRIQLARELESARIETEIEQLRSALLSSVSHDLKSPLAAMMGAAESLQLLDKQLNSADRQELQATIIQETRRLESYIQNLLDMTRLGRGELTIERDWVSVADVVAGATSRLKRYFPNVATQFESSQPEPLIYAHAALIEQALFNILENAARFTPAGEKIRITVRQTDHDCTIAIEDRGPGIPESLRERVFDMSYAAGERDRRQGTGMGLAICRGMVAAHGGEVYAEEGTDHVGTRVVVRLPADPLAALPDDLLAEGEDS